MFAVTGATGQLGRLVVERLAKTEGAGSVVALVRDVDRAAGILPEGVVVRQFDYDRIDGMTAALSGVSRLLLVSSSEIGRRVPQHRSVIAAAAEAGVEFLAYTSLLRADSSPMSLAAEHRATEEAIGQSGLRHAILRNGWYLENYLYGAAGAVEHGAMIGSGGEGRVSAATRADYADAAAAVLRSPPSDGARLELGGDQSFTEAEFAAAVAQVSGKTVNFVPMPEADYAAVLAQAGLPEPLAAMIANSSAGVADGALFDDSGTLGRLIGRPTVDWQAALQQTLAATTAA